MIAQRDEMLALVALTAADSRIVPTRHNLDVMSALVIAKRYCSPADAMCQGSRTA